VATTWSGALCRLLGVTLDSSLAFDKHVTNILRTRTFHNRALRHIRPLLTLEAAKASALSIVGSRLDYCNILFSVVPQSGISTDFSALEVLDDNRAL